MCAASVTVSHLPTLPASVCSLPASSQLTDTGSTITSNISSSGSSSDSSSG